MFKSASDSPVSTASISLVSGRTVATSSRVAGRGLHGGGRSVVQLRPTTQPGIRFLVGEAVVPVHVRHATAPGGRTRLEVGQARVDTPEHLLGAVAGLGITHLDIVLEGAELPALDGSAAEWVHALGEPVPAGPITGVGVDEPVVVEAFGGIARAWPADGVELQVDIDFGPAARGRFTLDLTPASFRDELAWARTFLPHAALDAVLASGRGQGVDPGSVVVLGPRGPLVPVRGAQECARHKALDLLGDLALAGAPIRGRFHVERGTHALHQALVRRLLKEPAPPPPRSG